MSILERIKQAFARKSYPETAFGMGKTTFFFTLLHACPAGSRLTFDQCEPAAFVIAFREWSHRSNVNSFEADYYSIDSGLITLMETLAEEGQLELFSHFSIQSPHGEALCSIRDDFMSVSLSPELEARMRGEPEVSKAPEGEACHSGT